MKIRNIAVLEMHAALCHVLANPKRLAILACLEDGRELSVSELAQAVGTPMSTISRHLNLLRSKYLVTTRQDANRVYYKAADQRIMEACNLIRTVLIEGMKQRGELAEEIDPSEIVED